MNNEGGTTGLTPIVNNPGRALDAFSTYRLTPKDHLEFDMTYIFTAPFWKGLELRLTVLDLLDKNPVPNQSRNGYFSQAGNPTGRQIEFGLSKRL